MPVLTIHGVDESTYQRIREQAAHNGRSMEAEVRATLSQVYCEVPFGSALLQAAERFRRSTGGVDLDVSRASVPRVPDLTGGDL